MIEVSIVVVIIFLVWYFFYNKKKIKKTYYIPIEQTDLIKDAELIRLINEHRIIIGLEPLKVCELLMELSKDKSNYMSDNNTLSHDHFTNYSQDAQAVNFGEIVAHGYNTSKSTINAYLNSETHKEVIEKAYYNWIGSTTTNNYNCIFFAQYENN